MSVVIQSTRGTLIAQCLTMMKFLKNSAMGIMVYFAIPAALLCLVFILTDNEAGRVASTFEKVSKKLDRLQDRLEDLTSSVATASDQPGMPPAPTPAPTQAVAASALTSSSAPSLAPSPIPTQISEKDE